jgi:ornithine cyclodeaminase/alanine dehydrogenase-like protein (mu-crystallin family)
VNGGVSLYSDADGTLSAIIDFHLVTKWKTAGDSLLAASRLARPDSEVVLIVGAGTVARSLREAYGALFPEARFLVWNRTAEKAEALAAETGMEAVRDLEAAVAEADIVSCATMSTEPVLRGAWLRPGQHIDLIGAYRPDMREADDAALKRARIFVDSRETTIGHIGELKIPLEQGLITEADVIADYYALDRFPRARRHHALQERGRRASRPHDLRLHPGALARLGCGQRGRRSRTGRWTRAEKAPMPTPIHQTSV